MAVNWKAFLFPFLALSAFVSGDAIGQEQQNQHIVIAADVELVQIPVIVLDKSGAVVTNLEKNDFRVIEDGVEQRLLYCDKERESVSFVILADVSQSMTNKLEFVRDATASILDPLYPHDSYQDEYTLFGIESRVKRLEPFTIDQEGIERRLPALIMPTKGGTALFDGIYAGASAAEQEAKNKRRAMIVISDGGDNASRHNVRQTRRFLEEAGLPVFAVIAGPEFELPVSPQQNPDFHNFPIPFSTANPNFIGPAERDGPRNLKTLTEITGGGVFTAHDPESLARITRTISGAVRYQYLLSYESQGTKEIKRKNNWHNIRIELIPNDKFKDYNIYYKRGFNRNEEARL